MLSSFQGFIRGIYPLYSSGPLLKDCRGDEEVGIQRFLPRKREKYIEDFPFHYLDS